MAAYATAADMLNAFDSRVLGDVCADDGNPIADGLLATNEKMTSALLRASGEVEASCLAGAMYSVEDLGNLSTNGNAVLVDLVCDIAMCKLLRRRPSRGSEELQKSVCEGAKERLEQLRKGQAVFGGSPNVGAAQLPTTTGPTTLTFNRLNMLVDRTNNVYPRRVLPDGRNY